ncbi:DNA repair helicase [Oesophagostomum dentatum]|uniref:DNA repair helicase n=1 Tax=Oesophagostomum dentatum TaxID=61180 RepID=A0A0B1TVI9_OESDE|nr:DNA repair helicase [Oesophagostomum dentatum]
MVTVRIRNIDVVFPFPPYDCQVAYMDKVIEAIEMKFDAALESPTGTGKTLSLLCSTLAWLQRQKLSLQATFQDAASQVAGGSAPSLSTFLPKVYYCSRTHSQLAQVVRELNRTMYKDIRVTVLGSRDQLCVHNKVCREVDNRVKTAMCRSMVSKRTCSFYNNWDSASLDDLNRTFSVNGGVPDIEDMVAIGKKNGLCPFYRCRQMQETAELVLLPYNYIIDPNLRKNHRIDLSGSVVIFDEAHNLESVCESAVSVEFSSTSLSLAIAELKEAIKCQREEIAAIRTELDNSSQAFSTDSVKDARQSKGPAFNVDEAAVLLKVLFDLEKRIEEAYDDKTGFSLADLPGKVYSGDRLPKIFEDAGICFDKVKAFIVLVTKIIEYLQMEIDLKPSFVERGKNLELFKDLLSVVYTSLSKEAALSIARRKVDINKVLVFYCCDCYAHLEDEWCADHYRDQWNFISVGRLHQKYWAVKNEHAAKGDQVLAAIVSKSPLSGCVLNGSFVGRYKESYAKGIAESILLIATTVPQGMLVFFASYALMNHMISSFKEMKCKEGSSRSYWDCMTEEKLVVVEPKQKIMLSSARCEFAEAVRSGRGAMFFAVCRGKVSEGIDFSDADSRAVCVVGIPFPPMMDARVCLKRLYMNKSAALDKNAQSSEEWYVTEGYRAVNQAVGRVIRHVHDFGIVALLDERFATARREYFPTWLRGSLKIFNDGSSMIKAVEKFFDGRNVDVAKSAKKAGVSRLRFATTEVRRSDAVTRKRNGLPMNEAAEKSCGFDYEMYSEKPTFTEQRLRDSHHVNSCDILALCNDEAVREHRSIPQTSCGLDIATSSSVRSDSVSQAVIQPTRKKLKMMVSLSGVFYPLYFVQAEIYKSTKRTALSI